ncbi:MAG TPA: hypothetical protein VFR81_06725, partial [Longimicrobium sp.]|nr:hypothetical protein [Longimicrobium sp.]
DWIGVLLGRPVVPPRQARPPFWRANHVHRQLWLSVFHLGGGDALDAYAGEIARRGLRFLEGYPSALHVLASHLVREGRTLPLAAVFTSSETLHAVQRETIEAAFACRVFDFYGHAERVIFAAECGEHAGKHLAEEFGYTEVVDGEGRPLPDGETGYLTGTTLHNLAMPLLRYRTGDLSVIEREPCACGRTLARIRAVTTKAEDLVVTPAGRLVPPSALTHPFKRAVGVLKSQIVQDAPGRLLVRVVADADFSAAEERRLADALRERLGPAMRVDVARVGDIPREKSGKFRWVISRVEHPCRVAWDDPAPAAEAVSASPAS